LDEDRDTKRSLGIRDKQTLYDRGKGRCENPAYRKLKRVAGYILLTIAFVINIPLQIGISVYGLIYAIRAFIDGNILTAIIAILIAAVCMVVAHFVRGLVLMPLERRAACLLGKTDIETISRDEREWQRKQTEKGYFEGKRSILDAEVQHIKDSCGGIFSSDHARNRQKRG
jgi:hypothetical protein